MKRLLLSFVLLFFTFNTVFAQKDTDHWIAPYFASTTYTQAVYLSTDSTTPFDVKIYTGDNFGTLLGTVTISKGNPITYPIQSSDIATNIANEAQTTLTKGIYLQGTKAFFCTLRMVASTTHAEIVTSKGKAGIGNEFYVANTPSQYSTTGNNFTAGILATEDNTNITVSWAGTPLFFGINAPTGNTITFKLDKGESYIFAGTGSPATNMSSFIGAKIVSDKPVSLTNGNVNGNFGTVTSSSGSDAILDQSVPTSRLGNTFAMVKSVTTTDDLEGAIVVATKNNTQVFVNGSGTALTTLNAGEWYRITLSSFVPQGTSGHYNMFISTTENVYVYQLVATTNNATCGFNYIPPLNCFLPKSIDEIAKINEMPLGPGGTSQVIPVGSPSSPTTLKLNILTEAGATVTYSINGGTPITPAAADGPYPLTGNATWVTYGITGIAGNVAIQSNKAVTAGINGGYSTSGYGGYFAGFSSVPVITKKSGECAPGIVLEVNAGYDTYQWYLNGNIIPGATSNTYAPLVGGNYTVKVTVGGCLTAATTPIFKVFSCLKETTKSDETCGPKIIQPTFTSSTQTPVASTVKIIIAPTNGTAVVNANGTITYSPNIGFAGTDVIVYKFCGNAPEFVDCEQVTHTIKIVPLVGKEPTLTACQYDTDPTALFDLTTANVTDYPAPSVKRYYPTLNDMNTNNNEITDPKKYASAGGFVYVKIAAEGGCNGTAKIKLVPVPIKRSPLLVDKFICIDDRTSLNAGTGYDSYQWSTGATTPSIQGLAVGEYSVVLEHNGCFLKQTVHVKKAQDPVITKIEITNNTATVIVSGGVAPFKYAVDGITTWQDSNVFTNLSRGQHTFYVKDAYDCTPISVEVTVPNLINAITPNGDNVNDYIDYSALAYKENLAFVIYDRYGNKIFTGDKFNNYRWDGKGSGKKIVTGTYWYHINWNEPNAAKTPIQYSGWILVKNRE
ncbi:T9SS type B sorting domain-containing protein [Chryseobacterium gwangjuense]|uniref:T9SS type B sorting domain-containing protein n=1 Tax=Chryseobacterium gwangjuense TaxID=1069980 RepID=UPI001E4A75BB|nr:T9SS type B sorting domain-containing protein [Chryseobacterium gwangjuense]MCE3077247.1 gliding motility-associated C-terminal domain-containing protein [Chryseobacterium gwangjuense]